MERKILRKIFGPVKDNISGQWRRRKNTELEILFLPEEKEEEMNIQAFTKYNNLI